MSLKNISGRKAASPQTINIPAKYNNPEDSVLFREIKNRMYELWAIIKSDSSVTPIDSDYTTEGSGIFLATNSITITLNDSPANQEKVQIKNTGGIITIDGNGKNIDGSQTLIVDKVWDAPTIIYLQDQDQWYLF